MGLICNQKSFQKPMPDGVTLLNAIWDAIWDVYLNKDVTVA